MSGDDLASIATAYDANGNQTTRRKSDGTETTLRYSVRDRLIEVREDDTLTGSYLYDHQGLRVAKRSGTGETTRYVYDERSVLLQTDLSGDTIAKYDYGAERLLSLDHATEGRQFYLFDALGSVVNLTTPSGAIQARYIYDAWGNFRHTAGSSANPFGFTGHERDEETGLYYAKARYYDPELGLFLSEDPALGQIDTPPSLHRYLYAYQNPTVYVDPTGRQNVFTPNEAIQDTVELQQLEQDLVAAQDASNAARDDPASFSDEELRNIFLQPVLLQGRIEKLRERLQKQEQFFGEVALVLEGVESPENQRIRLFNFLRQEKGVASFERALRLTTSILGPLECDIYCQRLPNPSDGEMMVMEFLEAVALNSAFGGLFELGVLAYADDAVRVTALLDDAAVLGDDAARTAAGLDDVVQLGDDVGRGARRTPSRGPLKNASGDLDEAAQAGRTQPHGASPRTGTGSSSGARFPENPSQVEHIFRDASGHLPDTPANRRLLREVANDPATTLGKDRFGNVWSAHTLEDGTQVWVQTRNGVIQNGGLNQTPRAFNPETGLSSQ